MKKINLLYGLEATGGGALKHLVYLITRLNKEKFEISVILSHSRGGAINDEIKKIKDAGAKVILCPMCRNIHPLKDFHVLLKLIWFLYINKQDIVHAHSSKAGALFRLAARVCRVPFVFYTPHCFYFQGKSGFKKSFFLQIEKILGKLTTGIIVSESEKNQAMKHNLVLPSKIIEINNAIDFDEYQQNNEVEQTKKSFGIESSAFIVGAIGRLVAQKDWETYVLAANEVLKNYPDTLFLIVGEGELYGEVLNLIIKLDLEDKIFLTGHVNEIHKIYGIIDVFVNTSLWEGLPYVFLEAMKYKKPIIATNTGDQSTIIHEENGFLSPARDFHNIADKIILLIKDKKMSLRMGKTGKKHLTDKYSFEIFIRQHEMLYMNSYYNQ